MWKKALPVAVGCGLLVLVQSNLAVADDTISGRWKFNADMSTDLASWRYREPELEIRAAGDTIVILQRWGRGSQIAFVDSLIVTPGGSPNSLPVSEAFWYENWYMGVLAKVGEPRIVRGEWEVPDQRLIVRTELTVETSQGDTKMLTTRAYYREGEHLIVVEQRSSRPTPIRLVFQRIGSTQ